MKALLTSFLFALMTLVFPCSNPGGSWDVYPGHIMEHPFRERQEERDGGRAVLAKWCCVSKEGSARQQAEQGPCKDGLSNAFWWCCCPWGRGGELRDGHPAPALPDPLLILHQGMCFQGKHCKRGFLSLLSPPAVKLWVGKASLLSYEKRL